MAHVDELNWSELIELVRSLDVAAHPRRPRFSDARIVQVLLWARRWNRPVSWACRPGSWRGAAQRQELPSPSTMTRRLRSASVLALLERLEEALRPRETELVHAVDGKPLVVSRHSTDPDARHGRGAGGYDKGYKLHAICSLTGSIVAWRVTPMHTPEQEMARRMVRTGGVEAGYLLADTLFDWDKLHTCCEQHGVRLLVPRRPSRRGKGLRERGVGEARRACIAAMETPTASFAPSLYAERQVVERVFARLETRWQIGHPPFHVRRLPRVRLWVQAALILDQALYSLAG